METIADTILADANDDYIGLWQVVNRVVKHAASLPEEAIRKETIEVLRLLLEKGLVTGNLRADGSFEPWPDQELDAVINKIEVEWNRLGHRPEIGDIGWLNKS